MAIEDIQGLRVLLIDAPTAHGDGIGSALEDLQPFVRIERAGQASKTTERFTGSSYDAVIAHWDHPWGGAGLLSRMRAGTAFQNIATLAFSNNPDCPSLVAAFLDGQVDAYMVAPVRPGELFDKLMAAVMRRHTADASQATSKAMPRH